MEENQSNIIKDKYGKVYKYKEIYTQEKTKTEYHIMVFNENNKNVGSIFATTRKNAKETEIEYYIHDKKYENRSLATAMLNTMLKKFFTQGDLNIMQHLFKPKYKSALDTVCLAITYNDEQKNEASLRVAQKCGFYIPEPKYGKVNATLTKEDYLKQNAQTQDLPKLEKQDYIEPKISNKNSEKVA